MRYLKKFNESISRETIEDILLELKDIGLTIEFRDEYATKDDYYSRIGTGNGFILVYYTGEYDYIKYDDIKDCLLRVKDYLGDNFICAFHTADKTRIKIDFDSLYFSPMHYMTGKYFNLNENTKIDYTKVKTFVIKYKK